MTRVAPRALLVVAALVVACLSSSRVPLPGRGRTAVVFPDAWVGSCVGGIAFPGKASKIYRLQEGNLEGSVMMLTDIDGLTLPLPGQVPPALDLCERRLECQENTENTTCYVRSWLPAGQRMALGIPLHPDRMDRDDWRALSRVGARLSERIMADRQKNGDFVTLGAVARVRGIGPATLQMWQPFFSDAQLPEK